MSKTTIGIIAVVVVVIIGVINFGGASSVAVQKNLQSLQSDFTRKEETGTSSEELTWEEQDVENQGIDAMAKTSKVLNQKISTIVPNDTTKNLDLTLSNGEKFSIPKTSQNNCQAGDTITEFIENNQEFVCQDVVNSSTRRGFRPGGILTDLLLLNFISGNNFLRNNGYTAFRNGNGNSNSSGNGFGYNNVNGNSFSVENGEAVKTSAGSKSNSGSKSTGVSGSTKGGFGSGSKSGGS
jgi:hypothetical protein